MQEQTIPCRWCNGKGRRKMSPPLLKVFTAIQKLGQPSCVEIFAEINNCGHRTRVHKQVNRLLAMKVITKASKKGESPPRYTAV